MADRRPILVTGGHRSGTGWVGRMIAATPSPNIAYLWEPFSPLHRPGICDARFPLWFQYVCADNAATYERPIADMLALRYRTGAELRAVRTPKDVGRLVRDRSRFERYRRDQAVPLMKDPIAVFSAEWLSDRFDMDVVVLIRHPAAFVYSVKRLGWTHPFGDFLAQPRLMRDILHRYEPEVARFVAQERSPFEQGILLWNLIHEGIRSFRDRRPGWTFLRLEDLASDPTSGFRDLYARLGLAFTDDVLATIAEHSSDRNPEMASRLDDVHRDSRASMLTWKVRLTETEISTIRAGVEPVAKDFYGDDDW